MNMRKNPFFLQMAFGQMFHIPSSFSQSGQAHAVQLKMCQIAYFIYAKNDEWQVATADAERPQIHSV
jgi:hypothetical protein